MPLRAVPVLSLFLAILFLNVPAGAQALHGLHEGANVPCAACHREDPPAPVANETCVACHGTMIEPREDDAAAMPDPHRSPHLGADEVPVCTECHSIHGQSEVTCVMCHRGFEFDIK